MQRVDQPQIFTTVTRSTVTKQTPTNKKETTTCAFPYKEEDVSTNHETYFKEKYLDTYNINKIII